MVATTEESKSVVVVAEMDSAVPTKTMVVAETTPTTPKPTPLEVVQPTRSDELDERSDNELSPRANSDNDDAMKYGFGAGMRMYAKSLAMAEKQGASPPSVRKLTPVRKVDPVVVVKPLSPKAATTPNATLSPTASTLSPKVATPKVETAAAPVAAVATPKSPEPTLEEVAITTPAAAAAAAPAAVAVATPKAAAPAVAVAPVDEVAAVPVKSIACVNIVSQIQDFFGEFFRKTEDVVDDCHERVCNRETHSCASTAMKTVASTEQEDNEMVESSAAEPKEVDAAVAKEGEVTTLSA
jgi:hypothetical protein